MSKKTKAIPFNHLFFSKSEDFLTLYLTEQRNHSPATVKAYKQSLTDFRKYTLDVKNISTQIAIASCNSFFSDARW